MEAPVPLYLSPEKAIAVPGHRPPLVAAPDHFSVAGQSRRTQVDVRRVASPPRSRPGASTRRQSDNLRNRSIQPARSTGRGLANDSGTPELGCVKPSVVACSAMRGAGAARNGTPYLASPI